VNLSATTTTIRPEPPDSPASLHLVARYLDELLERLGVHACCGDLAEEAAQYRPPTGCFLVVRQADQPVGCGAIRALGAEIGEVKRMWVAPSARGQGVGRSLLAALENEARRTGYRMLRLDTRRELVEAVSLYRARGYHEVPDYNANPDADVWFEKQL
jgi:GNAT superfamily N-acetyltransferase